VQRTKTGVAASPRGLCAHGSRTFFVRARAASSARRAAASAAGRGLRGLRLRFAT